MKYCYVNPITPIGDDCEETPILMLAGWNSWSRLDPPRYGADARAKESPQAIRKIENGSFVGSLLAFSPNSDEIKHARVDWALLIFFSVFSVGNVKSDNYPRIVQLFSADDSRNTIFLCFNSAKRDKQSLHSISFSYPLSIRKLFFLLFFIDILSASTFALISPSLGQWNFCNSNQSIEINVPPWLAQLLQIAQHFCFC